MQPSEPITAIYARQSRKRNSSYSSCDDQVSVCQKLENACRFEIREVYIDEGESSESLDRIQMNRLLAAVDAGEVKRLIVYSIDRLTRRLMYQTVYCIFPEKNLSIQKNNARHDERNALRSNANIFWSSRHFANV
jgi:hypothetical protein